jgi:hypothetical protein
MPRSNLGGSFMVPDPPHFDWELLESTSGLTFTEPQRAKLAVEMHFLLRRLTTQHATAPIKDVKNHCERIYKHAKALVDLLLLHLKNAPSDDYQINLHQAVFGLFPTNIDRDIYVRLLIHLRIGAKVALTRLRAEG